MPFVKNTAIEESARCLLCLDAPCTKACPNGAQPDRFIRSLRFDNLNGAKAFVKNCAECSAPCMTACTRAKIDRPVEIRQTAEYIASAAKDAEPKADLSMTFCGLKCENPFFLSSSVVASGYDMCAKALDMGWAGIVYKTIGFAKMNEVSPRFDILNKETTPYIGFKNLEQISDHPLEENLAILKKLKENYPTKIIVSSIMDESEDEWTELARLSEEAGVDMIECNFSCPQMTSHSMGSDVGTNPELVAKYTAAVRRGTKLPVLAKMTPNITNMEIPAIAAVNAGANGIAAINTVKSITNVDLDSFVPTPDINGKSAVGGYSGKAVKPIALRFISDMKRNETLENVEISGMGGIETWRDGLEFILMGCTNLQVTTSVMQYGYRIIDDMLDGLSRWLTAAGYSSVSEVVGLANKNMTDAGSLDRDTVTYPIFDKNKCIGCGRCYIACYDAGHQALDFDAEARKPVFLGSKCVGCHLCATVCPVNCISKAKRVAKKH